MNLVAGMSRDRCRFDSIVLFRMISIWRFGNTDALRALNATHINLRCSWNINSCFVNIVFENNLIKAYNNIAFAWCLLTIYLELFQIFWLFPS